MKLPQTIFFFILSFLFLFSCENSKSDKKTEPNIRKEAPKPNQNNTPLNKKKVKKKDTLRPIIALN